MRNRKQSGGDSKTPSVMRWVGYVTAVISLVGALGGGARYFYHRAQNRRQAAVLLGAAAVQTAAHDDVAAWSTLDRAATLGERSDEVRVARQNTAIDWLDNIRTTEGQKFSDITSKLEPVIVQGIDAAQTGAERGDLLAHLGWIHFLRTRDGEGGLDPASSYAKALQQDPNNPYAHAMWGHWLLWKGDPSDEERRHFAIAVSSGRALDLVRSLQLSALLNGSSAASGDEVIQAANSIRKEKGTIPPDTRSRLFQVYRERLLSGENSGEFLMALLPPEHLDAFRWLFPEQDNASRRPEYDVCLAYLLVSAGQTQEAGKLLRPLKANEQKYSIALNRAVNGLLKRL